jgi:hypothetical protein
VEKPEGKRPLGRSDLRGEGNIKTDLQEMVWGRVDWIDMAQDMDKWRALGKALWNFELCKMQGMSGLAPEEVLRSMELVGWLVGWLVCWLVVWLR